jgi:5'-nucleotidase/UDP-sugar diphosphatase
MRLPLARILGIFLLAATGVHAEAPDALLLIVGDQHSAYERTAQLVARVDRLRTENPGVPLAILIDGDALELGNVVGRRSAGAIDFAMFAALARRAPTVLNLGNHEPEFYAVDDTVARIQATGVTVISNLVIRGTGTLFAPASTRLHLGAQEAVVVGVATDHLATYRVAVRPTLDPADPVVWARKNFPALLASAPLRLVLSHAGLQADRALLPLVPDGTLFAGAHDHLRFVHHAGRTVYFHSGSWNEFFSVATLRHDALGPLWDVQQLRLDVADPADPELAALIRATLAKHLTTADTAIIGHTSRALSPGEAARFVAQTLRAGAGVDAAFIGNTTFGAGLPAGDVTRVAFDACVRFDGTVFVAEVDGAQLRTFLGASNQGADTPFAERRGEYLVADGPAEISPTRRYRIATTDWGARNARACFGSDTLGFTERPELKLKTIAAAALAPAATAR